MGEVYRARDPKLDRDVALKVLLPEVTNDPERLTRGAIPLDDALPAKGG